MHSYIFIISQNVKAETISNSELFDKVDHWGVNFGVDYTDTLNENEKKRAIERLSIYFSLHAPEGNCNRYAISISSERQVEMLHSIHQKLLRNLSKFEREINLPSGVNHAQFYLQNLARIATGMEDEFIFFNVDDEGLYTLQDITVFEMTSNAKYYVIDAFDYHF